MDQLFRKIRKTAVVAAGCLLSLSVATASATEPGIQYRVTITNITKGQTFTPQLMVTHRDQVALFTSGQAASAGLEILAEDGNPATLAAEVQQRVGSTVTIPGLLAPGRSVSTVVSPRWGQTHLSIAAKLIPTNDAFMAVNTVRLPVAGQKIVRAVAYDAGTEANDQNCWNIPGPRCGGVGHSPGSNPGEEGFVHVSNGFHDLAPDVGGDVLSPFVDDWRNPVAVIRVQRIH